jgi:hypothetical protein
MTRIRPSAPPARSRAARFFFAHLGTLSSIVLYVVVAERAGWSTAGVTRALWLALGVQTTYLLLARALDEHKQFDLVVWVLYAAGALAALAGLEGVLLAYRRYFGALLFGSFALATVAPLLLGREPFTVWHAVRQTPRWQHGTPWFAEANRVLAWFWAGVFVAAALSCLARPTDPMFTLVYPNLLVLLVGLPATRWLPPLWFGFFPPPLPDTAVPLIMGMPLAFDPAAAGTARAVFQFRVSGEDAGDYVVRVAEGRCESFEGTAEAADLLVETSDAVWVGIVRGEIDGLQALVERRYAVHGDLELLAKLGQWFRPAA